MKKSNLLFSAVMALAVGSLASCSSDDLVTEVQGQETTVDHDQVRYLNVAIVNSTGTGTRAVEFETGKGFENHVDKMTFVFYDAAGVPTGESYTIDDNDLNDQFTDETERPSVNKIYTSVIPVRLNQGNNLPKYVMCFINPTVATADLEKMTLDEVKEAERTAVVSGTGDNRRFPMSNSVYYGINPITGETDVRMIATPVVTGQLFTSYDAAKDAKDKVVDIYVERYAARVSLTLDPNNIHPNEADVNGYTLKFVPEYWRPNAIDQSIYVIKRYGLIGEDGNPDYNPLYDALANNFGGGNSWWNDPTNYRSYWACSPSYYDNDYPKVSDEITDEVPNNAHTNQYPYKLHYFNYDQIKNSTSGSEVVLQPSIAWNPTSGFNEIFYARETTAAARAWNDAKKYNPLATMASAVIVGRYQLTATDGTEVPAETTFYLYGKTNEKWNLYLSDVDVIKEMVAHQNIVLTKNGNSYSPYKEMTGFIVDHPEASVRGESTVAGRLVALQIDKGNIPEGLYYYDSASANSNKYEPVTTDNIDNVNAALLSAGYARKYGKGLCYFNIPIEHLGEAVKTDDGKSYDFEKCPAGSFGIVRNHAYNINITGISGLATALRDETQPIVPPMDEVSYYISARLNILNWRIVPPQNVEL